MHNIVYTILQWTWGSPQSIAGAALRIRHRHAPHYNYHGAHVTEWDMDRGISLGKFIFVPSRRTAHGGKLPSGTDFLLEHEFGHTIQSLILGPLYLPLVGIPSIIWNRLPYFARLRRRTGKSYYSVIFERTASTLGARTKHSNYSITNQKH